MTEGEGAVEQKETNVATLRPALPRRGAVSLRLTGSRKARSEAAPPKPTTGAAWPNFRNIGKAKPFRTARRQSRIASNVTLWQQSRIKPIVFLLPTAHCPLPTILVLLLTAYCLLLTTSCRRDMQDQPKMKPYRSSAFFTDGQSSRQLVKGTVPRGFLRLDTEFFTGKKRGKSTSPGVPAETKSGPQPSATASPAGPTPQGAAAYPDDVEVFPLAVTKEMVIRGKERFEIFCSACHGLTGNGDGMIVRRGFRRAASFNDDRLRQAPVGHFFDAITNGWGAMPSYASQIPAQDRWAIIAYVRALQLSQQTQAQMPSGQAPVQAPAQTSPSRSPAPPAGGQHP